MKPSVLYLSYTGLLEPLGRSQVLAYLKRLSTEHAITLVTFEKAADLADDAAMRAMHAECAEHAIEWRPRRYHHRPRLLATLYDVAAITAIVAVRGVRGEVQLVHCRGYVTALGAWLAGRGTGVPFIFDMRALWIDEMLLSGRLRRTSVLERALRRVEQRLLRDAAAVVSLTNAAVSHLEKRDPVLAKQRFRVIPTCVELERFEAETAGHLDSEAPVLGSVGTISSGWLPVELLIRLYGELARERPKARLRVLTRDDARLIHDAVREQGLPDRHVVVKSCSPAEVPAQMRGMAVGFAVFHGEGVGKLGSMPTRIAEFLAAGIPVIGNRGVGDVGDLVARHQVGVVLEGTDQPSLARAVQQLIELWRDPGLPHRCRQVARDHFSVERGVASYAQLWNGATRQSHAPEASR